MSEGVILSSCSLCLSHRVCLLSGPATLFVFKMKCHGSKRRKENLQEEGLRVITSMPRRQLAFELDLVVKLELCMLNCTVAFWEKEGALAKVWR